MKMIRIKEIVFNSSDYKKAVTIREEILRIPLGISFSKEEPKKRQRIIAGEFNFIGAVIKPNIDGKTLY